MNHSEKTIRPLYPFTEGGSSGSAVDGQVLGEAIAEETGKDEIENEEARCPRIARRPQTPTKAEVEAHMTLHAEYRDWCPHCVHGRGMSRQHRNKGSEKLGR